MTQRPSPDLRRIVAERRTTIQFLHLNSPHRINERIVLLQAGIRLVDREIRKPR